MQCLYKRHTQVETLQYGVYMQMLLKNGVLCPITW
jgi:hypothetical protein